MQKAIGSQFKNNKGLLYEIIELSKDKRGKTTYKIRFVNSGYEKIVYGHNIHNGKVKDPFEPNVEGVGYLGNASYAGNEKAWNLWRGILKRCCNKNSTDYHAYGGNGVTICERWKSFEMFLKDIVLIEGYNEEMFQKGLFELDKDKKSGDNKIYSLETCTFLTRQENNSLKTHYKIRNFIALSPSGQKYEARNIAKFAKEHGLSESSISLCLSGKYKQHKGWKFESYNSKYNSI